MCLSATESQTQFYLYSNATVSDLRLSLVSVIYFYCAIRRTLWNIECKTNIPCYIRCIAVLSWDTIAWIATVTFIAQTIINSREISFPKLHPLPSLPLAPSAFPNTSGTVSAFCSEPQESESSHEARAKLFRRDGREEVNSWTGYFRPGISIKQDPARDNIADCSMRSFRRLSKFSSRSFKTRDIREKKTRDCVTSVRIRSAESSSIGNNKLLLQTISMEFVLSASFL